ncbi:uncharacterized protein LOC106657121 isoform X1 [Trichogramma pretiosum]|uniref:uncharacterized protein LOC106657121 isoform X1 n=1 Tax=Trichogramma pretiosum TaxID=7493 RepID=UPI000C71C4D6|nr:uncharacterized protein LOC106657121 isoform X1 [Trichogramma pretiosum]
MKNLKKYYRDNVFRIVDYIHDYRQNERYKNNHLDALNEFVYNGVSNEHLFENKSTPDTHNPKNYKIEDKSPRRNTSTMEPSYSQTQNYYQDPRCFGMLSSRYHLDEHVKSNRWEDANYYDVNVKYGIYRAKQQNSRKTYWNLKFGEKKISMETNFDCFTHQM